MDGDDGGRSVRTETKHKGTFTTHWHEEGFKKFLNAELRERRKKGDFSCSINREWSTRHTTGVLTAWNQWNEEWVKKKELKQKLDYVEMPASQPDAAVATTRQQLRYYWYTLTMIHWAWPSLTVAAEQEQLQHFSSTNHHDFSHHKQEEKHGVRWHARVVN